MKLYLFDDDKIITFILPIENIGDFWMTDSKGNNAVNIHSNINNWILSGSEKTKVYDTNGNTDNIILKPKAYYAVVKDDKKFLLLSDYNDDLSFDSYKIVDGTTLNLGKANSNDICINFPNVNDQHLSITFSQNKWKINSFENSLYYLNEEKKLSGEIFINNGDEINIYGFKILFVSGMLFINNPFNNLIYSNKLQKIEILVNDNITNEEIINKDLYDDKDYFLRSPRMKRFVQTYEMNIDPPPAKENLQDTPLWVTLAPMLTMAASSMMSLTNVISSIAEGTKTLKQSIPSLVITITMMMSIMVWPFFIKKYEKKKKIKKEEERQQKYKNYLNKKRIELSQEYDLQKRILNENLITPNACYDIIINKRRTLWERKLDQEDFLNVRVGIGQTPLNIDLKYHFSDFSMEDDDLKISCESLIRGFESLDNVPIGYSFLENRFSAIAGISEYYLKFINNSLLQMMAYHSYDILKIIVFTSEANKNRWNYLKESPFCFSNDKSIRFFATNENEVRTVSDYLLKEYNNRKTLASSGNARERVEAYYEFGSYYLFIIDNIDEARDSDILRIILKDKINLGFSTIIVEEKLSKLPDEINNIITVSEKTSVIIKNNNSSQIRFNNELVDNFDMLACSNLLSNLPVFIDKVKKELPNSISFLEMFGVGQVEQLNSLSRWKSNDPTISLRTEVGFNENNGKFIIDLHEKQHGPHGLIAGMTGSGKSEFIISYILSMAVNYSPEEVNFVLIDYKGGGLAGAFVNNVTGKKLPHVVGTITNLDKTEINRALASIKSELTRRQQKFNEVRDKVGESTIDIYKYQKLYRDGVIDEPIPHLIIVSDEFAELKEQQPDFMDDLVSTARIGRSLGVHLILATQKPTGVVDAQIWSNAKFKICLKVQDKQDSMEMIKCDLAAELKQVGRFYLQVGYNEYFAKGQAAWAGAKYFPNKEFKKALDKNLYVIDNVGNIRKTINNGIAKNKLISNGEELTNILNYIINIASAKKLTIKQLWQEKMENLIIISDLLKKYEHKEEKFIIDVPIGEYDDPTNQIKGLLTLPLTIEGNTLIYGMSDSGKDDLLQTITYNIISSHTSSEVNLYLIDFGAETLINFISAPQVGDVILGGDEEKLINFSKMINTELKKRKKLFTEFNGNYLDYLKLSGKTLPNIIVIINSVEVMNELYYEYIEKFVPVIREGQKYGITFVISTESQNSIKMKVSQSCKQILCLQLANETSYKDILGKTNGLVPSSNIGRGLVKKDMICEFQTAMISENSKIYGAIKELISNISMDTDKAPRIPIMPEIIDNEIFKNKYMGVDSIPVGISKEALIKTTYNFRKNVSTYISSNDYESMKLFILNFANTLNENDSFIKAIIDAGNIFDKFDYNYTYSNYDFDSIISKLYETNKKILETLKNNNMNIRSLDNVKNIFCVVIGFDKFYSKLSEDSKVKFKTILETNKEALKITFAFIDIPAGFKKYEYDEWYKLYINFGDGIWIGRGFTQQFLIKTTTQSTTFSNIENEYGVVIKNSVPIVIKLLNEIKNE